MKIISSNCLPSWLPKVLLPGRANKRLTKKILKEKLGDKMSTRSFVKVLRIPGTLEGYTQAQSFAHAQERPEKTLSCHFWLTLRLCKQEVNVKTKF